ncbi:MAG: PEFG-CTERM sorting domain-containing protein [Thaumarchaeota archaeon]|nr:PEFG-CTERM sorting domain-containing protein [Nitrososphaerota archaeon]
MNKVYFVFIMGALISIQLFESVYATTYDINMPSGSSSPDAPYFWQNEKTGAATGDIEILVGDTIVWKNGGQAIHAIESGTIEDGPDGVFGVTDLDPGEFYKFTFPEKGRFPYYCFIHPWMIGVVTVTNVGYKIIPDIGKNTGDGLSSFNVDYQYSGIIPNARINEEQKSITFQLESDAKSIDHNLMMLLPSELIEGPFVIFVDDKKSLDFEYIPGDDVNTIEIELSDTSKVLTIVGTKIIPEFGVLSIIVLGVAITSIIFIQKSRVNLTL